MGPASQSGCKLGVCEVELETLLQFLAVVQVAGLQADVGAVRTVTRKGSLSLWRQAVYP